MQSPKHLAEPPQTEVALVSDSDSVRAALQKILAWEPFARSERLSRFLRYTVEQALDNPAPQLKEYVIAVEVFDKPKTFDARLDPIVRVEARRLRTRIREYYETEGRSDRVRIQFGARGYKPTFERVDVREGMDEPGAVAGAAAGTPSSGPRAIAVLPFVDLSPQPQESHLAASVTEELINALGRSAVIRVASRTSTRRYDNQSFDIREAGRDLGVDAILEGSVRQDTSRIRFAAQLYSTQDGLEIWSRAYERPAADTFALVGDIAASISESLSLRLGAGKDTQAAAKSPANMNAYRHYLRGLQYFRNGEDSATALENLRRAIDEEPGFAAAHAGYALAHACLAWFAEIRPADAWPTAESAATAALEIDPFQAPAQTVLACKLALFDWNWKVAERAFLRALELNKEEPVAHEWYASACLVPLLRLDEAAKEIEKAQMLDPLSPLVQCQAGVIHFYRGDTERARTLFLSALDIEPEFWPAMWNLARLQLHAGELEPAEGTLERAKQMSGPATLVEGYLGYCYAKGPAPERAHALLQQFETTSRDRYVSPLNSARVHLGLGQIDEALSKIEMARQHRCTRLAELSADPIYEPLRIEPRFQAIVQAVGLPVQ